MSLYVGFLITVKFTQVQLGTKKGGGDGTKKQNKTINQPKIKSLTKEKRECKIQVGKSILNLEKKNVQKMRGLLCVNFMN